MMRMQYTLISIIRSLMNIIDEMYTFICSEIPEDKIDGIEPLYDSMHDVANDIEKLEHIR